MAQNGRGEHQAERAPADVAEQKQALAAKDRAVSLAGAPILALEDVSFQYPRALSPSLFGVSLSARAGEVVALLGENGAGKSTLLRLAAALVTAARGTVRIEGHDVLATRRRELARAVAFVPQSEHTPAGFRVREVVAMGRAAHQGAWMHERPEDMVAISEALRRCDLEPLASRRMETLSGGEQRRVGIARALAQKPRLLLLDEAGAFLDIRHRLDLYGRMAEITRTEGIACVCALHDLDTAARFASRVVLLQGGRIVAAGPPDEVLTPGRLEEVLGTKVAVGRHAETGERYFLPLQRGG
jgi:iron complex transport system ATP-binding protein